MFATKEIVHDESVTTVKEFPLVEVVDANREAEAGSKSDLIGSFIVELVGLKNLAEEEGATKTAAAAETFIQMKRVQFENLEKRQ